MAPSSLTPRHSDTPPRFSTAHVACLQSSFVRERTHLLFDIAHREANTRMVKFAASIGAARCQTFADEARSEGFIGVEGDDPSIYWTYKTPSGFGPNENKTAGVYAAARRRPSLRPSHRPSLTRLPSSSFPSAATPSTSRPSVRSTPRTPPSSSTTA